jgi:hypothetical protein
VTRELQRRDAERLRASGLTDRISTAGGEVFGEELLIAARDIERRRPFARSEVTRLEAGQTLAAIVGEVRLADLTVVHEVHAAVDLSPHDIGHALAQPARERIRIVRLSACLGEDHVFEIVGARQGAGVRGEDTIGTAFHRGQRFYRRRGRPL